MKSTAQKTKAKAGARAGSADRIDPAVAAVLDSHPKPVRGKLLALRALILDAARRTEGVGRLDEALKWGQASYLTSESGSGSTVRIDRVKSADQVAVYFHCQTSLVETFRELYPELSFPATARFCWMPGRSFPRRSCATA